MSIFKLVLWDIGNVLNHADHGITHQHLVAHGVSPDLAKKFYTTPVYGDFARGKLSGLDFWYHQVIENLHTDLSLLQVAQAHDEHMYQPDDLALSLVERCVAPIAFATSTNVWQNRRERELLGDLNRFKPVWTFRSNQHGLLKTDAGCMALIADELSRRANVHASQILFIDDSAGNREAAERVGMVTYPYVANTGSGACEAYLAGLGLIS